MLPQLPMLYRVATRLTGNHFQAEELVSHTLLCAYKGWHSFDGNFLRSWLVRIMRNERARILPPENSLETEIEELERTADELDLWAKVQMDLDVARVLQEIDYLPPNYRMAIVLCDVEQFSYEEAASVLNVPIGTVRSRLNRARSLVRKKLIHIGTEVKS